MTDIDKAVELARTFCDECAGGEHCTCDMCIIARAVLAMAAVVEASRTVLRASTQPKPFVEASLNGLDLAIRTLDAEARRG